MRWTDCMLLILQNIGNSPHQSSGQSIRNIFPKDCHLASWGLGKYNDIFLYLVLEQDSVWDTLEFVHLLVFARKFVN